MKRTINYFEGVREREFYLSAARLGSGQNYGGVVNVGHHVIRTPPPKIQHLKCYRIALT